MRDGADALLCVCVQEDSATSWKDRLNAMEKERSDVLERLADSEAVVGWEGGGKGRRERGGRDGGRGG